ncbi:MAG: AAA family ATPase [Acidimicrobiia bacterium]|nr:AAA family ATPase [Acidimicrobiia bacterium]
MDRVVVVGNSGSGKTTMSRKIADSLGVPVLELDAVHHLEGWKHPSDEDFRKEISRFTNQDRWVVDGNYTSHGASELIWPLADTVVWLDPPRRVVMGRVIGRTLRRVLTREVLWNGNREPWTNLYSRDPYKNIIVWAWTRFDHVRAKYEECLADGTWAHADVYRLRTEPEVRRLLDSLADVAHDTQS